VIRRTGDVKALLIATPIMWLHPLLVALVPNLGAILAIEFAANLVAAGVNLSHATIWLELLPAGRKYSATAIYTIVMNIGAFVGPLAGVALAEHLGITNVLLLGAGMRLAGAAAFRLWPVMSAGQADPPSAHAA